MSYVDEILERVISQNPAQPEFHQALNLFASSSKLTRRSTGKKPCLSV